MNGHANRFELEPIAVDVPQVAVGEESFPLPHVDGITGYKMVNQLLV